MPGHHPSAHARTRPDHPALVIADTGEVLTYRALDQGSNRVAHLLRVLGLEPGDHVALMLRNGPDFACAYWGATRSGLMVTLLSTHLKPDEARYILGDCRAKALIVSASLGETPRTLVEDGSVQHTFVTDLNRDSPYLNCAVFSEALAAMPDTPAADEISGFHMLYSSGTTGRPKGIAVPFTPGPIDEYNPSEGRPDMYAAFDPLLALNAGPLYHAAPLSGMVLTHRLGGTFVTLRKFDAAALLAAIERHRVNHAQFVPTMFVRMLALPEAERAKYDLSSLKFAIHGAAPCPVEIKRRMIEWWGPIIMEYYSSTEGVGAAAITSEEWLRKPGSVGRTSMGPIHICADDGRELPAGEEGGDLVRSSTRQDHQISRRSRESAQGNSPRSRPVVHRRRYRADGRGRLSVPHRPQGLHDHHRRGQHLSAGDRGLPDRPPQGRGRGGDRGGQSRLRRGSAGGDRAQSWAEAGPALEAELRDWCATRISRITQPRSYEFVPELPRIPSGKLAKHELRKLYGNP